MTRQPEHNQRQKLPGLQGHAIGVVDDAESCAAMTDALSQAGFPDSRILVFAGDDGLGLVERMLAGSTWGESAEEFLKQCINELTDGHFVVCVEVENQRQAETVAAIESRCGGRSIYHFGLLVDTRLTG